MLKIMNRIAILLLLIICAVSMVGCGQKKGKLFKKKYVLKRVAENVPDEKYKFSRIEKVKDAEVSTEIYYFESKERDFEFTAVNTRQPIMYESGLYGKSLRVQYADDVHNLYTDDIESAIRKADYDFTHNRFVIRSFGELAAIAKVISEADDYYKEELQYNSKEWMMENPAYSCKIYLKQQNEEGKESSYSVGGVNIDGSWDYDKLYDYLCFKYASCVKKGDFADDSVPEKVMQKAHVPVLRNVYINSVNVSETAYENAKANHLINNTESCYYSTYCYALNDYIIQLDAAMLKDDYAPKHMEEILSLLTFDYEIEYGKGKITWEYNDAKWMIEGKNKKNGDLNSFKIYKDGKDLNIPFVVYGDWTASLTGTYIAGIRATDFAEIFNLDMEVDEENECIKFTER